ncbi:MAG: hypothetical protein HYY96_11110 [Candidatus Tectomicrobia bacterium]|nr:hypothetical protein [Candidatus Tectomicrobia bacterium]
MARCTLVPPAPAVRPFAPLWSLERSRAADDVGESQVRPGRQNQRRFLGCVCLAGWFPCSLLNLPRRRWHVRRRLTPRTVASPLRALGTCLAVAALLGLGMSPPLAAQPPPHVSLYRPLAPTPFNALLDALVAKLRERGMTVREERLPPAPQPDPRGAPLAAEPPDRPAGEAPAAAPGQPPGVFLVLGLELAGRLASPASQPLLVLSENCANGATLPDWLRQRRGPTQIYCLALSTQQWLLPLRRLLPQGSRLGLIALEAPPPAPSPAAPGPPPTVLDGSLAALGAELATLGVQLITQGVPSPDAVPAALRLARPRIDALWVPPRSILLRAEYIPEILRFSLEERLPVFVPTQSLVRAGYLAAAEVDETALLENLLQTVARLGGAQPAEPPGPTPAPAPARYAVNVETARRLGLRVHAEELRWAHAVFPFPFEVQDLLDRYAEAFQREDARRYEAAFWEPTARQLKGFDRLMRTARNIQVEFETQRVEYTEGAARMQIHVVQIFTFIDEMSGRQVSLRAPFQFQLERRQNEWRITGMQQGG